MSPASAEAVLSSLPWERAAYKDTRVKVLKDPYSLANVQIYRPEPVVIKAEDFVIGGMLPTFQVQSVHLGTIFPCFHLISRTSDETKRDLSVPHRARRLQREAVGYHAKGVLGRATFAPKSETFVSQLLLKAPSNCGASAETFLVETFHRPFFLNSNLSVHESSHTFSLGGKSRHCYPSVPPGKQGGGEPN